jgi:hypothetical protein
MDIILHTTEKPLATQDDLTMRMVTVDDSPIVRECEQLDVFHRI